MPPINGLRLQLIPLCQALSPRHEVCVLAYRRPADEWAAPAGVELIPIDLPHRSRIGRAVGWARAGATPSVATALTGPMAAAVRDLCADRSFDVAHVTGTALGGLIDTLRPLPAVLAALDVWHLNLAAGASLAPRTQRPLYRLEAERARRFESRIYGRYNRVVMVSPEDAQNAQEIDPSARVEAIPNGVDTERFAPMPGVEREPGHIVLTGQMHWAPNVEAAMFLAREVMPALRARHPGAHLSIVGRGPRPEVAELDSLEGVDVVGEVPDIGEWLARAQVYACPMVSGTGIKNKLLEALASEAPCVATSLACQGLGVESGEHLLVGDSAQELAGAMGRLLADPPLAERLGAAGRAYTVANHSWDSVGWAYERVYERAITDRGACPAPGSPNA